MGLANQWYLSRVSGKKRDVKRFKTYVLKQFIPALTIPGLVMMGYGLMGLKRLVRSRGGCSKEQAQRSNTADQQQCGAAQPLWTADSMEKNILR